MFDDEVENQLPLASRIAGIDQSVNILTFDQAGQQFETIVSLGDRFQREMRRDHRKMCECPLPSLDFEFLRDGQFEQVADRGSQDIVIRLEIVLFALETAKGTGNVLRDRWFLCDDQLLAHAVRIPWKR